MPSKRPADLKNVCAELSADGSIVLPGVKLWLVPAEGMDKPYIISTWVRSYRQIAATIKHYRGGEKTRKISDDGFLLSYPPLVERLVPQTLVLKTEEGPACHGYICGKGAQGTVPPVIHYIYLPPELRGLGISKAMSQALCGDAGTVHITNYWPKAEWPNGWVFNPYRIHE